MTAQTIWIVTLYGYDDETRKDSVEDKSAYATRAGAFDYANRLISEIPADVIERNEGWTNPVQGAHYAVVVFHNGDEWGYLVEELKLYP